MPDASSLRQDYLSKRITVDTINYQKCIFEDTMDALIQKYRGLLRQSHKPFVRQLATQINWNARAICIEGARGTGKSTLMIQQIRNHLSHDQSLYLSLDDLYFRQYTLSEVAEEFIGLGGKYLFIDEVHKYKNWQIEVKNLYDFHSELMMTISGSSILALQASEADLSRRMLRYQLPELSFREFIALKENVSLASYALNDILNNHSEIVDEILSIVPFPLNAIREYHAFGAYPFFLEGSEDYPMRLNQLINVIIDYDLPESKAIETSTLAKLKLLLYIISTCVPFMPNISKLANQVGTSRIRLLEMLHLLEKAQLIHNLRSAAHGISLMNKPEKIFLHNTNLITCLANGKPDSGNIRETFFLSQLSNAGHQVLHPKSGDFIVDDQYVFEVGGKNKKSVQIKGITNSYVVADDIIHGAGNKIPLWLFGFLY